MHAARRPSRIPNSPIRVGNRWRTADGRSVPVVAGGEGEEAAQVPDDLTAVTDEDLSALEATLVAEFDALLDADSSDLAKMTELSDAIKRVRTEGTDRAAADQEARDKIKALKDEVHGSDTGGDDGDGGDDGSGDDDGDDPGEDAGDAGDGPTGEGKREPITASARAAQRRKASSSRTSANTQRPAVNAAPQRVTITAAADLPSHSAGSVITMTQVSTSMHDKARSLSNGSPRVPVARFNLNLVASDTIKEGATQDQALDILERLCSPTQRGFDNATALVAAGGWCTPSQNMYDILALDAATGLLDVPSVGIERGGINIPSYIGIDATDGALWHWTEAQDAQTTIVITDLDVATGVGTATNTGTNLLVVGDVVDLAMSNSLMSGPHTVTAVADATHFTVNMAGVPDATNATGVATRQKNCFRIPCPTWGDTRLEAWGLCIEHGNLSNKAFPELTNRYTALVMNSHMHRMSAVWIAKIRSAAHADAVTVTAVGTDSYGELMSAVELSIVDYRSQYKISDRVIIEILLPTWTQEMLRTNLAMRAGVDLLAVSDATLAAHFALRNTRVQFLEDYQAMWNGTARVVWPSTIEFVIYPAGNFFEGNGGSIDLGVVRDSRLNKTNDFTAAWTEDFRLLGRRGPKARKVTATLTTDGITACCP